MEKESDLWARDSPLLAGLLTPDPETRKAALEDWANYFSDPARVNLRSPTLR